MNRPFRRSARRRSWSRLLPALALLLLLTSCSSTRRIADIDFAQLVRASQRLGFDIEYKDDHPLYVESASWIGTPYRYGGNDRHGVDCSARASSNTTIATATCANGASVPATSSSSGRRVRAASAAR